MQSFNLIAIDRNLLTMRHHWKRDCTDVQFEVWCGRFGGGAQSMIEDLGLLRALDRLKAMVGVKGLE